MSTDNTINLNDEVSTLTSRVLALTGSISIGVLHKHRSLMNSDATPDSLRLDLENSVVNNALCGSVKTIAEYYDTDQYDLLHGDNDILAKLERDYCAEPESITEHVRVKNNALREIQLLSKDEVVAMAGDNAEELSEELQSALDQLDDYSTDTNYLQDIQKKELSIEPVSDSVKINYGPRAYKQNPQPLEKSGVSKLMDKQHALQALNNTNSLSEQLQVMIESDKPLDATAAAALAMTHEVSQKEVSNIYKQLLSKTDRKDNTSSVEILKGTVVSPLTVEETNDCKPFPNNRSLFYRGDMSQLRTTDTAKHIEDDIFKTPSHIEQTIKMGTDAVMMDIATTLSLEQLISLVAAKLPMGSSINITSHQ